MLWDPEGCPETHCVKEKCEKKHARMTDRVVGSVVSGGRGHGHPGVSLANLT